MRKLIIRTLVRRKKTAIVIGVLVLALVIPSLYTLFGIYQNVQKMQTQEKVLYYPQYPAIKPTGQQPDLVKVGEYFVKAGDCIACHTKTSDRQAKPFAGGLAMRTPFGTIYSPNITPDKETGIGGWTQEQFIKAMRQGISPQGHYYYPAFPYLYFNKIKTNDLIAIKAYLDSLPPVHQVNQKNDMVWPFNYRFLQFGWRLLFFTRNDTGAYQEDPKKSSEWNQGAYLVEGLGHCAMCHSPSYHLFSSTIPLGAPIRKYSLTGSKIQGFLAPNITEANLATISNDEIIDVFLKDQLIGGGHVEGPMLEANHDSLSYLPRSDLNAIATYLKSVQSEMPPKPSGTSLGKGLYETYCSGCHATGSGGAPKYGDAAAWDPILKKPMDTIYSMAIKGNGGMPAKGTCISCNDDEIKQSVDYMIASVTGGAGTKVVSLPKTQKLTLADGQHIYETNCSVCHNSGFKGALKPGDKLAWGPTIKAGFLETYINVVTGRKGHPPRGACPTCSDAELKAAVKYMMTVSATDKNYDLW